MQKPEGFTVQGLTVSIRNMHAYRMHYAHAKPRNIISVPMFKLHSQGYGQHECHAVKIMV